MAPKAKKKVPQATMCNKFLETQLSRFVRIWRSFVIVEIYERLPL